MLCWVVLAGGVVAFWCRSVGIGGGCAVGMWPNLLRTVGVLVVEGIVLHWRG